MENNRKSMKKTNSRQFRKMVELMEQNPTIATGLGKIGSTKSSTKETWDVFAMQLNSLGPPLREGKEWHKVWLDFRLKTKKKLSAIRNEAIQTGGGPYRQLSLSPLEQAVNSLLNLKDAAAPSGQYFGETQLAKTVKFLLQCRKTMAKLSCLMKRRRSMTEESLTKTLRL